MQTNITKHRDSNLELYRVIVMLLIIAHHYVVNSGLMPLMQNSPITLNSIFLYLFGMWGKIGINCFVLITGYFMCQSNITVRKFLKLILEVVFYKIIIYLIFLFTGYAEFSFTKFVIGILPITSISNGFSSSFLVFFLCIPFLNILIANLSKKQHQKLLILLLSIYTVWESLPGIQVSYNYVTWFSIIFLIASYIRKYNPFPLFSTRQWGWLALCSVMISMFSVVGLVYIYRPFAYGFVTDSNAVLAVITSVCTFMYFKRINIKYSKLINLMGGSTFGVLLIHANSDTMRQWLWGDTLKNVDYFSSNNLYIHAIVSVVLIFVICVVIDRIRILTIEKFVFKYIDVLLTKYHLK